MKHRYSLCCEGFAVTDAIRELSEQVAQDIFTKVPQTISAHVFLSEISPGYFKALIQIKLGDREVVTNHTSKNLYTSLRKARSTLICHSHKELRKRSKPQRRGRRISHHRIGFAFT